MRHIAIASAGILLATTIASASSLNLPSPSLNYTPIELVQAQKKDAPKAAPAAKKEMPAAKKDETVTQKVKRTWRRWTSPSHSFCVRCPIPIPVTAKMCTAKGKTVDEARAVCQQQNQLCYVTAGKC
jgi:hypothetical protein